MKIHQTGIAGTLESSDITIHIEANEGKGIWIELKSTVENQFGKQIRYIIKDTLQKQDVTDVFVRAIDKGALDCTIRARVLTALSRAANCSLKLWEVK
ncbi:MAG: citrate lyase ACP [Clostridia bacterium BRH_c25]|nr:MAG: citrate lyase ACP [Clostridia bacterium BRH_c25]